MSMKQRGNEMNIVGKPTLQDSMVLRYFFVMLVVVVVVVVVRMVHSF